MAAVQMAEFDADSPEGGVDTADLAIENAAQYQENKKAVRKKWCKNQWELFKNDSSFDVKFGIYDI